MLVIQIRCIYVAIAGLISLVFRRRARLGSCVILALGMGGVWRRGMRVNRRNLRKGEE